MKRILMMMAMVLGIVVFAGCDPVEPQTVLQSFEVSVDATTRTSVTYSVTPALTDKEYVAVVMAAADVNLADEDAVLAQAVAQIKDDAAHSGQTFDERMQKIAVKGAIAKKEATGLALDTDYILVVFGVDPANAWENTTFPAVKEFSTLGVDMLDCSFDVTADVYMNSVNFDVVPSDKNVQWHLLAVMKSMYDSYTSPDGDYKWTKAAFYQAYTENEIQQYASSGMTEQEILDAMFFKGDQSLKAKGLNTQTEYIYLVGGFEIDGSNMYLVTDVAEGTFVTEDAAMSDLTFEVSVTDVEQMKAAILITPSNDTETFCWMCQEYDGVSTPEEVMNSIVAANKMWFDMGFMLYSGVQDFTGGPNSMYKYSLSKAGTEYCVIAFGYAGGVTTEPVMVTFTTLPGGNPADCTFEATLNSYGTYEASFNVIPSDVTTYYTAGLCPTELYDEDAFKAEAEMGIQQMVQMQQMFDPTATVGSVLAMYYWNGANTMEVDQLEPGTEYLLYIYAFDSETGAIAAAQSFPAFITTKQVSNILPSIELVGYFSGDDEAGAIFGQPDVTAGKSIAVVRYNVENASKLYSGIITGNAMNTEEYSDTDLMSQMKNYWSDIDLSQPYSFFVIDWTVEQTVLAYALDAEGSQGGLVRELICATAEEKGNIEDLKALVDELNSASKACTVSKELAKPVGKPVITAKPLDTIAK